MTFDPKVLKLNDRKYWSLDISLDYHRTPKRPHPVFLVTKENGLPAPDHWHIDINKRKARMLRDWLNRYLGE
jgi:hypothetical protein